MHIKEQVVGEAQGRKTRKTGKVEGRKSREGRESPKIAEPDPGNRWESLGPAGNPRKSQNPAPHGSRRLPLGLPLALLGLHLADLLGSPRISLDFLGCPRISLDFLGFPRISLDFLGFPQRSLDFLGFPWISSDFLGFPKISLDFLRFPQISSEFL